jgi:hypothetical protein
METSKTRKFEELKEDCKKGIGKITKEHYENYFRYAYHKATYRSGRRR